MGITLRVKLKVCLNLVQQPSLEWQYKYSLDLFYPRAAFSIHMQNRDVDSTTTTVYSTAISEFLIFKK